MAAIFISYRRDDSAGYAGRLHEELEQRLGQGQVFRDIEGLPVGQDFVDMIDQRLGQCSTLVAVIGRQWLNARTPSGAPRLGQPDDFVTHEIATALRRRDVLVIPVLVGDAAMPSPAQLPEKIRDLARRNALWLRDETWEADVDRLAAVISGEKRPGAIRPRRAAIVAVPLVLAGLVAVLVSRNRGEGGGVASQPDAEPAAAAAPPPAAPVAAVTTPYAIDVPALAEAAHGSVIYSLVSGSVAPRGGGKSGVRLRLRVSNEGHYDANLWDASFRLAIGSDVLTPTSGLNEVLPARSIRQAIVSFVVPSQASRAVLRVLGRDNAAEIPLDLSPTGRPAAEAEDADAGDALSRARLAWVLRESRPLIASDRLSVTLVGVTSRLFVNTLRIRAAVRFANGGRNPASSGELTMRLAAGNDMVAPASAPNEVIEPGSTFSGDFVFEIPPSSKTIELRASAGNETVNVPLEVR